MQSLQASCKHSAICHVTDNDGLSAQFVRCPLAQFVRCPLALSSQIRTLLATRWAGTYAEEGGWGAGTAAGHHLHAKQLRTQVGLSAALHNPQQMELSTKRLTYNWFAHSTCKQAKKVGPKSLLGSVHAVDVHISYSMKYICSTQLKEQSTEGYRG